MTRRRGRAPPAPPTAEVTPDTVARWFQDAAKENPHAGRGSRIPAAADPNVVNLARIVNVLAQATSAPSDTSADMRQSRQQHDVDRERARKAAAELADLLPELVADPLGVLTDDEVSGLNALAAALDTALPSLGKPPRRGRGREQWTLAADRLLPVILQAWEFAEWSCGCTDDGPVLRVAKEAVIAATGDQAVTLRALAQEYKKLAKH